MLNKSLSGFIQDERGSYTMWSVAWFMIYVGIGGLAVDATDVYRHETLLQATGDASSMAGVMSLPSETEAVDQALAYAQDNMQRTSHGTVLAATDVKLGTWDFENRTFAPGTADPNAVYVTTRREESNENPLRMNMLRFLSLAGGGDLWWNVNAESVAVRYHPKCANEGFLANHNVKWTNHNNYYNNFCIHAELDGVGHEGARDNTYEQVDKNNGVSISRGQRASLNFTESTIDSNDDLQGAVNRGGSVNELWASESKAVPNYIETLLKLPDVEYGDFTTDPAYEQYQSWEFLYPVDGARAPTGSPGYGEGLITVVPADGVYLPYHVYYFEDCGKLKLSEDTVLVNVAIVADCPIHASADLSAGNVILASTYTGNNNAITMAAKSKLGNKGFCREENYGVQLYTPGSVKVAANTEWYGVRVAAGGDVNLAANNFAHGVSVQAGGDINVTSNGDFGLCENSLPQGPIEWRFRIVQ